MPRVGVIVCTYVTLLGVSAVVAYRAGGVDAGRTGSQLYPHRTTTVHRVRAPDDRPPLVVWLGDSTLQGNPQFPSYAVTVQEQVLQPMGATSIVAAAPGVDFVGYWSLAGRVAALHPKLAIVIANLRTFIPQGGTRGLTDTMAEIDLADLPQTLALPYYVRGMTAPRLLLARALRTDVGEAAFLRFEGLRRNAQDSAMWSVLGPTERPSAPGEPFYKFGAEMERILVAYDRPIARDDALVQFAGATVGRLTREGIAVLVIVTPMPWERALEKRHYDPGRVGARIEVLRQTVEKPGGRLLDLHRALTRDYFRDVDCHFTAAGSAEMETLVAPVIREMLAATP